MAALVLPWQIALYVLRLDCSRSDGSKCVICPSDLMSKKVPNRCGLTLKLLSSDQSEPVAKTTWRTIQGCSCTSINNPINLSYNKKLIL